MRFVDVRVTAESWDRTSGAEHLPRCVRLDTSPPRSGPEYEVTFDYSHADPDGEPWSMQDAEANARETCEVAGLHVLASRTRGWFR